jgi:hypothetical protein
MSSKKISTHCPVCRAKLKTQNYQRHMRRIHGITTGNIHSEDLLKKLGSVQIEVLDGFQSAATSHTTSKRQKKARKLKNKIVTIEHRQQVSEEHRRKLEREAKVRLQEKIEREEMIKQTAVLYNVIWDDIIFDKNKIRFSPQRLQAILHSAELEGCIPQLETIRKEYFEYHHGRSFFKLAFYNSSLIDWLSPGWESLKAKIESGRKYFEYPTSESIQYVSRSMTGEQFFQQYQSIISKNRYLRLLAVKHHKDFPVMCIEERKLLTVEDTFIFRTYDRSKRVVMLWESVNARRATHVFRLSKGNYEEQSQRIQSFIKTPMAVKRLILHRTDATSLQLRKDLGHTDSLQHRNFDDYSKHISSLIA